MTQPSWAEHERVVQARERWGVVDALVLAIERFRLHRTGRHSALVAHYGFMSLFPLGLVFTTVLGFLLQGSPRLRKWILDSAFRDIPIVGPQLQADPTRLRGDLAVLLFGTVVTLWAGLRAFNVLQTALDDIADVPLGARPNLLRTRLRSLRGVLIVGGAQLGATVVAGLSGVGGVQNVHRVLLVLTTFAINAAAIAATYRYLCTARPTWREVRPGALAAGAVYALLQVAGTTFVARAIANASPVYGAFASVIGLITWLSVHAMALLLGAELNGVVRTRRPRT
jgi:uncharacterized BrkB/YihY/UPF0761 family membrane protein